MLCELKVGHGHGHYCQTRGKKPVYACVFIFVQVLNLKENQLVALPSTIGFCTSLVELHLGEGLKGGTIRGEGEEQRVRGCTCLTELHLGVCGWGGGWVQAIRYAQPLGHASS